MVVVGSSLGSLIPYCDISEACLPIVYNPAHMTLNAVSVTALSDGKGKILVSLVMEFEDCC